MRRLSLLNAVGLGGLAIALLAGCGAPPGTDGSITDDWPAPPAAKSWTPPVGACYRTFDPLASVELPKTVPCDREHVAETLHVGTFEEREVPPPEGSPEQRKAYEECHAKAKEFLGDDWRYGRLYLGVAIPTRPAWNGGARWFRCDVSEVNDENDYKDRTGSLKDALRGNRPVGYGCSAVTLKDDEITSTVSVECTKPHNAEFAGVFDLADGAYQANEKQRQDAAVAGCYTLIAKFVNVPNDDNLQDRIGVIWTEPGTREWGRGNRGVGCDLWVRNNVSRSMRGAGRGALPAR